MADESNDGSRPATIEDLKRVLRALNENEVEYLLIGGYAIAAQGYIRATTDIDILVPATVETGERVKRALLILPRQVSEEIDTEWFKDGDTIRVADEFVVDIMFNACGETYQSLVSELEVLEIDGIPVRTVSVEGLLRTKQTVREKDVLDRIVLERAIEKMKGRKP